MTTKEKLLARTIKDGDCLVWTGFICKSGYGLVWHDGKNRQVHRVSYELQNVPIADGLEVMHTCDNRKCVNPNHLRIGTHRENMADMLQKGRQRTISGIAHHNAKINPEIAAEIRRRYKPYDRTNGSMALAREFGLSQPAVHTVIRGETWR